MTTTSSNLLSHTHWHVHSWPGKGPGCNNGQSQQEQGSGGVRCMEPLPEIQDDVTTHGFWTRGTMANFNILVTDMDVPLQRGLDPGVILKHHEEEKNLEETGIMPSNQVEVDIEPVLVLGPKSLNPKLPDAMGLGFGALTV
eukprot:scaffold88744_cov43-Attheya_sp.AAC.1